jgi:hypothetical protein
MDRSAERQGTSAARLGVAALVAGLVVFALLFAWGGGISPFPPECFSMFGWYSVPCDARIAVAAGAVTAALVGLALWLKDRGWVRLGVALLTGFGMFLILVPTSGAREWCFSLLAFRVACQGELAMAAGALTAGLVGLATWLTTLRNWG